MKAKKYLILAAAILISSAVVYGAVRAVSERGTLQGVKGFHVLIEDLSSDAKAAGLSRERLKTLVELKLRMADVKVLPYDEEIPATVLRPTLYLRLYIQKVSESYAFAYAVIATLEFKQLVVLHRNKDIICFATTWEDRQGAVIVGTGNDSLVINHRLTNFAEKTVKELVDEFLNDYLAANPKEPTGTKPKPNNK